MKKITSWLERKGYPYRPTSYGGRYFHNVSCSVNAVLIELDRDNYLYPTKAEQDIFKYCKKYGYEVISSGYNLYCTWYGIVKAEDAPTIRSYWDITAASVAECEIIMHNYHMNGIYNSHHAQLEKELRQVMDRYESDYIRSCFHVVKAA